MKIDRSYFPSSAFIFALSGGVDSIAACHLTRKLGFDFVAIHVNCNFIDQDKEVPIKIKKFCKEYKIPYQILDVSNSYKKGSKEDYCRKIRYSELCESANDRDFESIVTAHHLDDCVESYFMNFLKGHTEFVPMQYICKYPNASVVRPFLLNKKVDFIKYINDNNLMKFVTEDELNSDLSLTRNWTRKEVIPMIEKKYKGLSTVVFKKMKKHLDEVINF
jgi:tRNA(Ile)-lysidine synthase